MKLAVPQHGDRENMPRFGASRRRPARPPRLAALLVLACSCASEAPPQPRHATLKSQHHGAAAARPASAPSPAPVDNTQARQRAEAKVSELATSIGLTAADVQWSPRRRSFALLAAPRPEDAATAVAKLLVGNGATGEKDAEFDVVRAGPPGELRFLDERRVVYVAPPAPASERAAARKGKAVPAVKTTTWIIQGITPGTAPIPCEGSRFVWSDKRDHLAWIGGEPGAEYVGADGQKAYPRAGVTTIKGAPAWSRDGHSLAFVELLGAGRPGAPKPPKNVHPKLVVLVEVDNPSGDLSWDLPANIDRSAMNVFWAGAGNVVVGESLTKPAYSSSFVRE